MINIFTEGGRHEAIRRARDAELIVVLHACTADTLDHVEPLVGSLQQRRGRLVSFVGNELNLPWSPLGPKITWLRAVKPDLIATQLLLEGGRYLYEGCAKRIISLPHALNTAIFQSHMNGVDRLIDLGARSYRYLAYLGDDDRNRIYDFFLQHRFEPPLNLDFSTEHRFDRPGWADFLGRCKGTIATEAGSWWLERDDRTVLAIRRWAAERQRGIVIPADSALQRLGRRLPHGLKAWLKRNLKRGLIRHEAFAAETLDSAEVFERFFAHQEKPPIYGKCISSRHFDAIGAGAVQIMFPGRYNDILEAGRHYIALNADFSNIDTVMEQFRDPSERRRISTAAFEHILAGHTYTHRIATLVDCL